MSNTVCQNSGLTTTRTSNNQQWTVYVFGGLVAVGGDEQPATRQRGAPVRQRADDVAQVGVGTFAQRPMPRRPAHLSCALPMDPSMHGLSAAVQRRM